MKKPKWILIGLSVLLISMSSCVERSPLKLGETLIEYSRAGGISGLDDHLLIDQSGNAILTRKSETYEFTLSPEKLVELSKLFYEAKFLELKPQYLPKQQGFDLIEYKILYNRYTVKAMDTAIPDSLQGIINELNQIIIEHGK
jgi:hypothetical protein